MRWVDQFPSGEWITFRAARSVYDLFVWVEASGVDVQSAFEWVASRQFVEHAPHGLRLHEAARIALLGLLRQHHPSLLAAVMRRVRRFYDWQLGQLSSSYDRWFGDRMYLALCAATLEEPVHLHDDDECSVVPSNPERRKLALDLTAARMGKDEARNIERWLAADVGHVDVLAEKDGCFAGYSLALYSTGEWPAAVLDDPALRVVDEHLRAQSLTVSPSNAALILRASLRVDEDTESFAVSALLASRLTRSILERSGTQLLFVVTRRPDAAHALYTTQDFVDEVVGTYRAGDHTYSLLFFDLRTRRRPVSVRADDSVAPPPSHRLATDRGRTDAPHSLEPSAFGDLLRARLRQLATAAGLTAREIEVLDLVVLDRNAIEIGKVLGISARTAKFHQARLLAKLGADSRMDLFRLLL